MCAFGELVSNRLISAGINFKVYCEYSSKKSMVLNKGNEFIQIMEYKDGFLLSWAMPRKKAIKYLRLVSMIEFDEDVVQCSKYLKRDNKSNEYGHVSIKLQEDVNWHLVIGKQIKKGDISEDWVVEKVTQFKNDMEGVNRIWPF